MSYSAEYHLRLYSQVMKLRQAKNELERKVQDQEEELDEQAGTIQQLEQVRPDLSYALWSRWWRGVVVASLV